MRSSPEGDIYVELDSLELAKQDYINVLRSDTGNIYALYQLGFIANLKDEYDSVIYYLDHAMKLKEINGVIFDFRTDDPSLSLNKYDIEATYIYYLLGQAYYNKNDIKNAFYRFDYCIKHQYSLPSSYLYRGLLYLSMKQREKACEDIKYAIVLGNRQAIEFQKEYCDK